MIIKLRNWLIAMIMAFISIIMLVAFASIYIVTYIRIYNENVEKINSNVKSSSAQHSPFPQRQWHDVTHHVRFINC